MISNLPHFIAIAETASKRGARYYERHSTRLPSGGRVNRPDPRSRSMRHSLVAIVFAGIALEALVYFYLRDAESKAQAKRMDKKRYRTRLRRVGVRDLKVLDAADKLQDARADIVHERALDPKDKHDMRRFRPRSAQSAARDAIACLTALREHLARITHDK